MEPQLEIPGAQFDMIDLAAPSTGNRHTDLLCYLRPGQALVAKLKDLLRGSWMSGSTAPTHGDAGATKVMAHCRRRDAQLGTDLAQGRPWAYKSAARFTSTAPP
jgi:hypothetical protein